MPSIPWDEFEKTGVIPEVAEAEPTQEQTAPLSGRMPWDEFEEQQRRGSEQPPAPQRQPLQHTPSPSPQLFPTGQDHVAREVLGLQPKPFQRSEVLPESHFGILGDVGSSIASGVLRYGEMALRDVKAFDVPGGRDAVRQWTTEGIEQIKQWEEEYPRIFKPSTADGHVGGFRRWINEGISGVVHSTLAGLPGLAAGAAVGTAVGGPFGAILGGALGFGLSAGTLFGIAEYDQFMDDAVASGMTREEALPYALASGASEGFGEFIADATVGLILPPQSATVFKGTIKSLLRPAITQMLKTTALRMPAEVITEMAQNYSQVALRQAAGIDTGDTTPWKAALEAIGPAMVMTALFGVGFHGKNAVQLRSIRNKLVNGDADPSSREAAANYVFENLKSKDKDLAELWRFNADQYIKAGYGIPVDRNTSEFLAWGESSAWSPEMAEELLDGKDIKLLPEGQGFVMVGDPYDTDAKNEYDQYNPELADKLVQAKGTKLLPDGQGFTMPGDITVYSPQLAKKLRAEKDKRLLEAPDRRAEAPAAPQVTPIPPVEAAARGVEAAIETGTPEDIAQAQRRLERRVEPPVPDRTLSLVRSALKATPEATIGDVYRSVKAVNPEASRQEVAKLYRQETRVEVPTTQKDLALALKDLGQEEFNHQFNPGKVGARRVKELTDEGVPFSEAKEQVRPFIEKYTENYNKVNEKALAKRAKEQAKKEEEAEKAKKAAEGVKKEKVKPGPQKKKLTAKPKKKAALVQKKEKVKPTLRKPSAAEAVAAMEKPKPLPTTGVFYRTKKEATQAKNAYTDGKNRVVVERAPDEWIVVEKPKGVKKKAKVTKLTPKRKKTEAVLSKKETEKLAEEIKPSAIRAGVEVDTPDGKGRVVDSPQKGQWNILMLDGWAKGEELIFAASELKSLEAPTIVKANMSKDHVNDVVDKVISLTKSNGGATVNLVTGKDMFGTDSYAIGVFPLETERVLGGLTAKKLHNFIDKNIDKLSNPVFNVGTWIDNKGVTHLDVSITEKELWKSIALAKEFGQEAIFHLGDAIELETKSNNKGKRRSLADVLTVLVELEADEPVHLVRYMSKEVPNSVDPSNKDHRTNVPGAEFKRLKDDHETPQRVHYYEKEGATEPHIEALEHKYETSIPRSKLYDLIVDPLNLRQKSTPKGQGRPNPNIAERLMRDAGYWGYQNHGGPFTSTVVIFEQLPVLKSEKVETAKARSSESIAREAEARRSTAFIRIIRNSFPSALSITPKKFLHDVFDVSLPNGAKIQVKVNAMPENLDFSELQANIERDISREVPLGLWVAGENVTITGEGIIYLAGIGDLQTSMDHEVYHAAKAIVLDRADSEQLKKDYPGDNPKHQEEREAEAFEKWAKTERSHDIFDKIRVFFRRIAERFGISKGRSYKIFRTIIDGKAWTREFKGVAEQRSAGKVKAAIYSLLDELPKFRKEGAIGQAVKEDIESDHKHWMHLGAVLYIEGINGREWTAEMTAQLKEHYLLDKLPQGTVKSIRKSAQWIFKQRTLETLSGNLPTMEALMEMEQRGAKEGGMVWYDERDGLSVMTESEDGEVVARSARAELEEYFGDDAEFMAGLIAHLSSGLQVPANTMKAIEVYIAHKSGFAFKGTHQVTEPQIKSFLKTRKTSGDKRVPFFHAIMGDANAIVIDRWMARVLDFRTWDNKNEEWVTSTGASKAQRKLLIAWVQRGAKRMGITPRAYQALIWAGKKALDEEASGRPTGSMDPLYKVIEEKIKVAGILAKDIPAGREGDYFILPGIDKWAINVAKFMPLKDQALLHTRPLRKPEEITVPKLKERKLTAAERKKLDAQQGQMFARMSESTVVEDSLDDIFGGKHKGTVQKMKDGIKRMKEWRTLILDEFHPILKHLGEKTYKLHRMLNGVHASVEAFMRHGKLKLSDEGHIVADGRNRGFAVWAKKHGRDAVNVLRWAAAKRSEQLERDNPEWLKNEEFLTEAKRERIYKEIGEAPEGGGTWEELHAEFDEFHQSVLDIAEKAGLIDEVVREDWRDLIYVPFYRVFEDTATREEFLANPKKAKDIAAKVKPIKGSKRKIGEPIENVIANWGYMIQESMRNQARAEAYVNAKMMNEVSDLMRDVDYQEIKHTIVNDKGVIR
jgi:hypothetical protein